MLGFLLGLMVGGAAFSGNPAPSGNVVSGLSQIPFRCIAALDESDEAYAICRTPSMMGELNASTMWVAGGLSSCYMLWTDRFIQEENKKEWGSRCDVSRNIAWEIKALKSLAAQEKK